VSELAEARVCPTAASEGPDDMNGGGLAQCNAVVLV